MRVAVRAPGPRQQLVGALVVGADVGDGVRVRDRLRIVLPGAGADPVVDPLASDLLLHGRVTLTLPLLPRQVGVRGREVERHHVAVEAVVDAADDERARALRLDRARGEQLPQGRLVPRTRHVLPPLHHHVDVLPVAQVVVPAVVERIEEPVLQHELEPAGDLGDEGVEVDRDPLPVFRAQGVGLRVGVGLLPGPRVAARVVEVEDAEQVVARLDGARPLDRRGRRVGVELAEQATQGIPARRREHVEGVAGHELVRGRRDVPGVDVEEAAAARVAERLEVHGGGVRVLDEDRREALAQAQQEVAAGVVEAVAGRHVAVAGVGRRAIEAEARAGRVLAHHPRVLERDVLDVLLGIDALRLGGNGAPQQGEGRERAGDDGERTDRAEGSHAAPT